VASVLEPDLMAAGLEIPEEQIESITLDPIGSAADQNVQKQPGQPLIDTDAVVNTLVAPEVHQPLEIDSISEDSDGSGQEETGLTVSGSSPQLTEKQTPGAPKQIITPKSDETIRVPVSLLSDLMNLAGEMVLGRNQLIRMAEGISQQITGLPALLQKINVVTSELQEKVMRTRMQPIGNIFGRFTRIVRDVSQRLGKEITLELSGKDVELDKSIIELLSDPLTHTIRNCADHGIERPETRSKAGKSRVGRVRLSARHEGGQVHIEIDDDGHGIDPAILRMKAVEKGLLTPQKAEKMTDHEALSIIFMPGFSTAEAVSDISGRGVGMDVVKANMERFGGSVDVESELGKGTRIVLRLPLTLAIIPSMIVVVGDRRFAVPQVNLEGVVRTDRDTKIEKVAGADVMRLRGVLLPVVDLPTLLGIPKSEGLPSAYVLLLKVDRHLFGLIVDGLLDSEEIVVKPLSSYLKRRRIVISH